MRTKIELAGQRFGRLEVIGYARSQRGKVLWNCACDCGARSAVRTDDLRAGRIVSCGCFRAEQRTKHGGWGTRLYWVWNAMLCRCTNPNDPGYGRYGGRGITVCSEWFDFAAFQRDMGDAPKNMTLERIDNDDGYRPGNVRWATRKEQSENQRRKTGRKFLAYGGEELCLRDWSEKLELPLSTIATRLTRGMAPERALAQSDLRRS